ncbi:MAG TPA: regulatory iron-sulfur-containing complex subunit RicT [Chitinophagaceae bacterium]|nr:regulatory iron-sulfur-containing complex subunit RicT [Chitinophagaceae bacterium]
MGCSSCGTNKNGTPAGCKSNGGCSSGGCNRLNVHDWLANLPFHDPESSCKIIEVSFNNGSRKEFYRNTTLQTFIKHEMVSVEGVSGFDVGEVSCTGELVRLQLKKKHVDEASPEIKKVLRRASEMDIQKWKENKAREAQALIRARAIARQLNLQMKVCEVEIQADGRKATFFYTADDRVDFRELIKLYASDFRVKVEMKQIGARQESAKVGGIGSCGRELCCSTWLSDFKSVTTTIARYQNLSINQTKLSGQCGRLKCCLNYELDTYLDALQHFPDNTDILETMKGNAVLVKKDIFRNLMWYVLPDSNMQYPLSIETVKKIKAMNMKGIKVEQLETTEVNSTVKKEIEPQFVDVVGQISLRTLERNSQKRKQKARDQREGNNPRSRDGNRDNRENPNRDNRDNRNKDNRDNRNKGGGSAGGNNSGSTGGKRDFRPQKPKNQ